MECRKCDGQGFSWVEVETDTYHGMSRDYCERCDGTGKVKPEEDE